MAASPENWKLIKEHFESALEAEPDRRASLLQEQCRDERVRAEVERLLFEHEQAGTFLSAPVIGSLTSDAVPATQTRDFDSYHLLELIGEGGMGEVWLAEQRKPVRRRVAIKLIKAGMDTREVVARFESERQALALMDHPAIAKVFDAGSTPEGRPYFVMEYVDGIPITAYCDEHKLTTRERMELFIQVCEGVQHAHQKAIIHRDLKPSNILVTQVDGKSVPRIIDFGLAKATSQRLTDASRYTQVGAILGTLDYMSPEQADSGGEDIDTRTDVYSLGVVLYQLLAGALPLDLKKLALQEMLRQLREQDVPRPSSRIALKDGDSAITAQNRSTDPPSLTRQLRGDPDAVVLKALEKDRKRRYGSPSELAADIGRYLRNEPVAAHPPSAAYRAGKYLRRHRLGATVVATAVLLLIGFAVTQAIQLRRITQERDRATRERDRADRITQFMTGMFKVSNPSEARGNSVTAREILDRASKDINTGLNNDPVLQAKMMYTMAITYDSLGLYSRAHPLMDQTINIQRRFLGPEDPETLQSTNSFATILTREGHYPEAEKLVRETLDIRRRLIGPEHPDTLQSINTLAYVLYQEGRYADAENLNRKALAIRRRVLGAEHPDTLVSMLNLADNLSNEDHYAEAEKLDREILDTERRVLGPDHPETLGTMHNVATDLNREGRYAEAEKLIRETLETERRVLGPEHPETLISLSSLAADFRDDGHYVEAEPLDREALDIRRRVYGPQHPSTLLCTIYLADDLSGEGHYAAAEKLYRSTLTIERGGIGSDHPDTAMAAYNLGCLLVREGRRDEAFSLLREAVEHGLRRDGLLGIDQDPTLKSLHNDPRFKSLVTEAHQIAAPKPK